MNDKKPHFHKAGGFFPPVGGLPPPIGEGGRALVSDFPAAAGESPSLSTPCGHWAKARWGLSAV